MSEISKKRLFGAAAAGTAAGIINGLLGGAGGMVLIPGLSLLAKLPEDELFPVSVAVMLPTTMVSLMICAFHHPLPFKTAWPYLIGSAVGGILSGIGGKRISVVWLHRLFGALLLWGGVRALWQIPS